MFELLRPITEIAPPFNMIVLIVLIGCVAGVINTIAKQACKYGCHRQDLEFKRELIDRGLPTDEIERIIAAQSPVSGEKQNTVRC